MVLTIEALSADGSPFRMTRLKHKLKKKAAPSTHQSRQPPCTGLYL